jgi:ribosomal-protein-alanine N-acetyltransferase
MDSIVKIRRLEVSDRDACKDLRLRLLASDPMAFGSTLEKESRYEDPTWTDRMLRGASSPTEATWVPEQKDGSLVGMIVGVYSQDKGVHVFGMWVGTELRGLGIGGALLDTLLRWAETTVPAADVLLMVAPTQVPAVALYRGRGFHPTGNVEPLERSPGTLVEEMVRRPGRSPLSDGQLTGA